MIGADSTSTRGNADGTQSYLDNEQKVFEVGESSTLGVVTWGMGQIGARSHRTRIAMLADELLSAPPASVAEVAARFAASVWSDYNRLIRTDLDQKIRDDLDQHRVALADPQASPETKVKAKSVLENAFVVGFCVAGHTVPNRAPEAYEITFNASLAGAPSAERVQEVKSWGSNLFVLRALGMATNAAGDILATGKWTGTREELESAIVAGKTPIQSFMPLRETIDMVHSLLQMTIKLMKFSSLPPNCGGPVELAAITSDRRFRWVRHKPLDAAIGES